MSVIFSPGLALFHSSILAWTLPPELSLPWTQVIGPVPSKVTGPSSFPREVEQAAIEASAAARAEPWMN